MTILYLDLLIELFSSDSSLSLLKFELDQSSLKIRNNHAGDEVIRQMEFKVNSILDVYVTCPQGNYQVRQLSWLMSHMCNF